MHDGSDPVADLADALRTIEQLQHAVRAHQHVGEAVGILMERYALTRDGAFNYLVRQSSITNVKLRDVAAEVVAQTSARHSQS
jgi:AmiR/NasT family two-component response regulator